MNMNRSGAIDLDLDDQEVTPEMVFHAVQDVVADVADFLSDWMRRFDQHLTDHAMTSTPDAVLRQQMEEFELVRQSWEAKRQAEERRLRESTDQITEAWLRLEDEQRMLLQMREAASTGARDRGSSVRHSQAAAPQAGNGEQEPSHYGFSSVTAPSQATEGRPLTRTETVSGEGSADPVDRVDLIPRPGQRGGTMAMISNSRESAIRQFQRLRREIESSRTSPSPS